jgi:hypothetical protein
MKCLKLTWKLPLVGRKCRHGVGRLQRTTAQPPRLIADYTISSCSRVTFVAILNGSTDLVDSRTSNGCSAEMQQIAHADLMLASFLLHIGRLTFTIYVRLRRPIGTLHDIKGRRRLNLPRITAITPDYIKGA